MKDLKLFSILLVVACAAGCAPKEEQRLGSSSTAQRADTQAAARAEAARTEAAATEAARVTAARTAAAATEAAAAAAARSEAARTAAADAAEELRAFNYEARTRFSEEMKTKVASLRESLDALGAGLESASATVRAEAVARQAALRVQVEALEARIAALDAATPTTWETIKADAVDAYVAVGDGFDDARRWLSNAIAP